ncbi:hypothetical protein CDV26_05765 [Francisella halioticida]|uniref:Integrase catalytic domain-containing protein n=1 Tax=Francisella halioticida TaxID=549298 RepID=A0ABM6LZI5_9GAMM|nr:hypothetical protein CDV26_05765 [Francisella halioticida]
MKIFYKVVLNNRDSLFFGTLKVELVHDESYKTREEAKLSIFEYIEAYYNTKRRHSTINYMLFLVYLHLVVNII